MTRSDAIASPLMGALAFAGLTYMNYTNARYAGLSVADAIVSFPVFGMAFLVPIRVVEIWSILAQPSNAVLLDPKRDVILEQKRIASVLSTCFFAAMVFLSIWKWPGFTGWMRPFNSPLWNVAGMILGGYVLILSLFAPRFRVELSLEGMRHSQLRPNFLRWTDVADVTLKTVIRTSTITVALRNERDFRPRSLLSGWQKFSSFTLNPSIFGADTEVFFEAIELRRAASVFS